MIEAERQVSTELRERLQANADHADGRSNFVHRHLWVRDDRPGWREWVCVVCAMTFGVAV